MGKSTELVPAAAGALAEVDELAELLRENARDGLANLQPDDIVLPFLSILQPTSPLTGEPGYAEGQLVNSITQENYGDELSFYILHFYKNRIHWIGPDPNAQVMECTAPDGLRGTYRDPEHADGHCGQCPFSQWTKDPNDPSKSVRPECTEFKNLIILPVNDGSIQDSAPIVYSAKRSALKAASTVISAVAASNKPSYAYLWTVKSDKRQRERQRWYIPRFTRGPVIDSIGLFHKLKEMSDGISQAQSRIRFNQEDERPAGEASRADERDGF